MRNRFLYCLFFFASFTSSAQTPIADSLQQLLQETKEDSIKLRLLDEITHQIYQIDFPKTIKIATQSLELAQKLDSAKYEMRAYYFIGVGHLLSSDKSLAIQQVKKALEIAEKRLEDSEGMMDCHNLLGNIYRDNNNIDSALYHFFASAGLAEAYDNPGRLATAYSNVGEVYLLNEDNKKAKSYYEKALSLLLSEEDFFYAAFVYNNLAEITEFPDSAIVLLNKAYDVFKKENYLDGIAQVSTNLASQYGKLKKYEQALIWLEKAREIFESESHNYKPGLVSVYMNLGVATGKLGDMKEAQKWFKKSISIAKEINHKFYLKDSYEQYADLLEDKNSYKQALYYFKLAAEVKDSLFNETKAKELADSETKYQTELKEKQLIQKDLKLENETRQKNRILLGGIILVLFLTAIFLFFRYRQRLRSQKAALDFQLKKAETEKLRELDKVKSNFFANISHEFRTPLTLILGPLKQMREGSFKGDTKKYQNIMIRNGERLMKLVNQLLSLSKLESGKMQLNLDKSDIVKTVKSMAFSFESLAERQEVNFEINIPNTNIFVMYDKDKLEKILINLLSNAFKFTSEKGTVKIEMEITKAEVPAIENRAIIKVKDTGMGIAPEDVSHIFERFFQTSNTSDLQVGSGVGLALTKELVELHKGHIFVESEVDKGTIFTLQIPIGFMPLKEDVAQMETKIITSTREDLGVGTQLTEISIAPKSAPLLLLVEDNGDVREYVKDQLKEEFRILEAENGEEGLGKAIKNTPDLIISDVMMPKMDGMEMSKLLKNNDKTSHIPIIMLTAKAEREDKIEGLQTGVDDYLMKPFDAKELKVRIQNLIEQRRRLQKNFGSNFDFSPESVVVNSIDKIFLTKVKSAIQENLDDETFSVVELGNAVNMSRSQLHRKLKAMTNQSPNQIIRNMRLLRAKELLSKKAGNASEIAYMVGFNSLAYFSKCYRDEFGVSPSEGVGVSD